MRPVIVPRLAPRGAPSTTWRNTSGERLRVTPPGVDAVVLPKGGVVQIPDADLAKWPDLAAWLEGLELAGKLAIEAH